MMGSGKSTPMKKRNKTSQKPTPLELPALQRIRPPRKTRQSSRIQQEQPLDLTCKPHKQLNFSNCESLGRCSTPSGEFCDHCLHSHAEDCCLYMNDTHEDKQHYSKFKQHLESPRRTPAFAGNSTPSHFPEYTPNDPKIFEQKMAKGFPSSIPLVYIRQYYYPYATANQPKMPAATTPLFPTPFHHMYPHFMLPAPPQPIYANIPVAASTCSNYVSPLNAFIQQPHIYQLAAPTVFYA